MLFPPTLGRVRASARAQLLAETLGRELGERVNVRVAQTYAELEGKVLEKRVDVAWAPPSICAHAEERELTILKAVRQGRSMYRSALICRQGDNLTLENLQDKRAAWVDPLSTGGHLLAISLLRQQGINTNSLFSSQEFHGSYQGSLLSLIRCQADVSSIYAYGTEDVDVRHSLSEHVGASEVQLHSIAFTDESPSDGLIYTGNSELASELVELLLNDPQNRARALLLDLIEAETLERAAHNDYWAVRQALAGL
ncbi:MAG: phosphate/phosphite/phosphonate ABC transporter substrate-binding protein [Myxococcales bacterium]|nr:phosphate/phosphite/phosphonate ABC transporter substrate-binding protein [Myxococcales bacterium]